MTVPLKILITDGKLLDDPGLAEQVAKLNKAGHDVAVGEPWLLRYDFIVGPNCWLLRPEVANLFTLAVTNARKIANADEGRKRENQERLNKKSAAKVSKRSTGKPRKVASRKPKVKEPVDSTPDTIHTDSRQLDFTTDIEADSFGAGG